MEQSTLRYIPQAVNPKDSAKVYFACHPQDREACFDALSQDLLTAAQQVGTTVTVWYREGQVNAEQLDAMQLVVVPVTRLLLQDRKACLEPEVCYARQKNIPILPILLEDVSPEQYSLPENFGQLQYLDPRQNDATALPYAKKLQDSLDTVLVTDQLRQQIRQAFGAYIFLSYRKKDRQAAQALMKRIHENEFCRDIAIWYDEFLTPGENFSQAIETALEKSKLFALVVTPNITEAHNYVVEHEYPMAQKCQKPILPLTCEPTEQAELKRSFADLPPVTDSHDGAQLTRALQEKLQDVPRTDTPQQHYLMGLAYLTGVDVEVDTQKALALLEQAAQEQQPQAMLALANMYRCGNGVALDYERAVHWQEDACGVLVGLYQREGSRWRETLIRALTQTAEGYNMLGDLGSCQRFAREAVMYCTLGFRDTGEIRLIGWALEQQILRINAKIEQVATEKPDMTDRETTQLVIEQLLEVDRYLDAQQLSPEQLEALGERPASIYLQLSYAYASLGDKEKALTYEEKANRCGGLPQAGAELTHQMTAALTDDALDLNSWMDIVARSAEYIQQEFRATPNGQKAAYLTNLLSTWPETARSFCTMAENLDPEAEPAAFEKLDRMMVWTAQLFDQMETEQASNNTLTQLASLYGWLGHFWNLRGDVTAAEGFVQRQLALGQLSFDRYPTEAALTQLIYAVEEIEDLDPDGPLHTQLWLQLEQNWNTVFRKTLKTASGLQKLAYIYGWLLDGHLREGKLVEAEVYARKKENALRSKFRNTNSVADELECLDAGYVFYQLQQHNGRSLVDSSLKNLLRRYGQLMADPQGAGLDAQQQNTVTVGYVKTMWLLGKTLLGYGNTEEGVPLLNEYLRVFQANNRPALLEQEAMEAQELLLTAGAIELN